MFGARFGLDGAANFEGEWHLCVRSSLESIAEARQLSLTKPPGSLGRLEDIVAWLAKWFPVCTYTLPRTAPSSEANS